MAKKIFTYALEAVSNFRFFPVNFFPALGLNFGPQNPFPISVHANFLPHLFGMENESSFFKVFKSFEAGKGGT
jgi:hypothetical protein